jgi:hypothetical protein
MKQSELRGLDIEASPRKMAIARGGPASPAYLQPLSPRIQLAQSQVGREPSSARTFVGLQRAHIDATHRTAKVLFPQFHGLADEVIWAAKRCWFSNSRGVVQPMAE